MNKKLFKKGMGTLRKRQKNPTIKISKKKTREIFFILKVIKKPNIISKFACKSLILICNGNVFFQLSKVFTQ